jgi:hypothetical protein
MTSRTRTRTEESAGGGGETSRTLGSLNADERAELTDGMRVALARIEIQLLINDAPEVVLGCLKKSGAVRRFFLSAVTWPGTNALLLLLLLINAASLASYRPTSSSDDSSRTVLLLNLGLNVAFTVEVLAKIVAFGLYGKGSFLAYGWNRLALGIVAISYIAFVPGVGQLSALRLLRVFEWMHKVRGFRIVLNTCINSLPGMQSVALLCLMTYTVSRQATLLPTARLR